MYNYTNTLNTHAHKVLVLHTLRVLTIIASLESNVYQLEVWFRSGPLINIRESSCEYGLRKFYQ